jgi:erythronate-4-phosphate dehydrogenase
LETEWTPALELEAEAGTLEVGAGSAEAALAEATRLAYPIDRDDAALRATLGMRAEAAAAEFDRLRREYPVRREFGAYLLKVSRGATGMRTAAEGLGFRVI